MSRIGEAIEAAEIAVNEDVTVTDLGGRKRRVTIIPGQNYVDPDGVLKKRDVSQSRIDSGTYLIDAVPFSLRISPDVPRYQFASKAGSVDVELLSAGGKGLAGVGAIKSGRSFMFADIAEATDYVIDPTPTGVRTLLILKSADAPRTWSWRTVDESRLLSPLVGRDDNGRVCELDYALVGDTLTATWTGRVAWQRDLRKLGAEAWDADATFPVRIDPTVNENVAAGADDGYTPVGSSYWYDSNDIQVATNLTGGVRFQTIDVVQGVTVNSGTLTLYKTNSTTQNIRVYGDYVADAPAFATGAQNPNNITQTTAFATTSTSTTNTAYNWDVAAILQEIFAHPSWAANNDIRFGLFGLTGTSSARFDEFGDANPPTLSFDYTVPSTGQPSSKRMGGVAFAAGGIRGDGMRRWAPSV